MKISYNWLQEYFEKELPNPKDLADLLNLRALEVEEVEEKDGDSIFEIKVTPNRAPDCLSHIGIAREVALHTNIKMKELQSLNVEPDFETEWKVEAEDNSCVRYMMQEVKNVTVAESPLELKLKLEAIGQRSINTIVDITNLVMYEIGQPMHAFDADKLEGKIIKVAKPIQKKFTTLDNKEIDLTEEDCTIQDQKDNLAIAGVKGGKKAEVDSKTQNIILESANFFPVKVRKTSRRTGIQTDSSKRFENGLTPKLAEKALHLACFYIKKYASQDSTKFSNVLDVYSRPQKRKYIVGLDYEHVAQKLGVEISKEEVEKILTNLGIEFEIINPRKEILEAVQTVLGKPYKWGASVLYDAPEQFDCSSLTSYLYSMGGISIPRMTVDQFVFFKKINKEDAQPGDLIFSNTGEDRGHGIHFESKEFLPKTKVEGGIDHVGMYMSDNQVLHAGSDVDQGVLIESLEGNSHFKDVRGFGVCIDTDSVYRLFIPYERLDLKTEIDIIEEIGRVYGYEHIKPTALDLPAQENISEYEKIATIKSILIQNGFDEVITYSFGTKGDIEVVKPLAEDKGYLRKNMIVGLADALDLNFRNKELFAEDSVKIFEIGTVFVEEGEKVMLGLATRSAHKKDKSKIVLENMLQIFSSKLGIEIQAEIKDGQEVVEIELDQILEKNLVVENNLHELADIIYKPFSLYPFMTRDVAVWAGGSKGKSDIEKIITDNGTNLLLRYDLFDEFSKEDRTSYAYRLVFQSFEKTLTDEEVNPIMDKIYATLQSDSDFEIR